MAAPGRTGVAVVTQRTAQNARLATLFAAVILVATSRPTAAQAPAGDIFDRVVAVVGSSVLTESDVDLMTEIRLVEIGRHGERATAEFRNKAVQYLIVQQLISGEARRLAFQRVHDEQVEARIQAFRAKFPSPAAYTRFLENNELSPRDLGDLFRKTLLADRFAKDSVRLSVRVSDADIAQWLARNPAHPSVAGRRPDVAREAARQILYDERFQRGLRAWVAGLRRRSRVRLLVVYR
jgi:hypothetical protein